MRRDWTAAVEAHDGKPCRVCLRWPRQLAHIIPRKYDVQPGRRPTVVKVHPDAVVPLCLEHHQAYDAHRLNLLPHLRANEVGRALLRLGDAAFRYIEGPDFEASHVGDIRPPAAI